MANLPDGQTKQPTLWQRGQSSFHTFLDPPLSFWNTCAGGMSAQHMKELRGIHSDSPLSSQHGRLVFTLDIFTSSRCQISHSTWALGLALELHFWLLNSKKCGWNSSPSDLHSASHIPLLINAHIPTFPFMVDHAEPSHLRWRCVKLCVYKMLLIEAIELHFARLCHRNSYLQTNGCKQRLQVGGMLHCLGWLLRLIGLLVLVSLSSFLKSRSVWNLLGALHRP